MTRASAWTAAGAGRDPLAAGTGTNRRARLLLSLLIAACAILVLLFGSTLAIQLSTDHAERLRAARGQTASLSQALEAHMLRTLKSVDLALHVLKDEIERRLPVTDLDGALSDEEINLGAGRLDEVRAFAVLDRDGNSVAVSTTADSAGTARSNFADRPYFQRHRERNGGGYIIDGPFVSRVSDDTFMTLSRRIDAPDGSFAGVVVAGIYLDHFREFYATLDLPPAAVVALFERDGTFVLRYPDPAGVMGADVSGRPLFTEHLPQAEHGLYTSPPQSDGTVRITAFRTVADFDLVVAVAYSREQVLAGWWQRLAVEGLLFALFCAVLAAAAGYGVLQYRRLAISNSEYRIADRRRAEYQRQQRAVLDAAPANIAILDIEGRIVEVNEAWRRFARESGIQHPRGGIGEAYLEVCHGDAGANAHADEAARNLRAVLDGREVMAELEYPCHTKTARCWHRVIFSPLPNEAGGAIATHVDITDRKQAELVLRRHARQQQSIAALGQQVLEREGLENGLARTGELVAEAVDADSVALYRHREDELVRLSGSGRERPQTLVRNGSEAPEWQAISRNETLVLRASVPLAEGGMSHAPRIVAFVPIRRGGAPWGVLTVGFTFADEPGEETLTFLESIATILGNALSRRDEQRQLSENEGFLAAVLDNMGDALVTYDETGYIIRANRAAHEIYGYPPGGMIGMPARELVPDHLRDGAVAAYRRHIRDGLGSAQGRRQKFEGRYSDGTSFPVELVISETRRDAQRFFIALLRDLTEANRLESQLRQWQRLEAIGQLTGGIAHDFNNLLTVILGNAELLREGLLEGAEVEQALASITGASENAVELTSRLLAFARRQPLAPASFDMNTLVESMERLLRRTVPEDIVLRLDLAIGLQEAQADRNQLENAIINLVVNARDAIDEGGAIHLETGNAVLDEAYCRINPEVQPGDYVMIAVSDDGYGMSPDEVDRAFEPFFTTKPAGRGTGLGLSMVYGFARQSGGHAKIYSEPGHGTTVRIYLPRAIGSADEIEPVPEVGAPPLAQPGETVLVVEDNPQVRAYAVQLVGSLGYRVIEAGDGVEALDLLESDRRIDLVFTDMVMPGGLTGTELAEHARTLRPQVAVLCTTGYAPGVISGRHGAETANSMLAKPYRREELAASLRDILDRHAS